MKRFMRFLGSPALFFGLCSLALLSSCDMDKNVDIPLPGYTKQPVVEAYIENGQPFRLLLTETSNYFDSPIPVPIKGAVITLTRLGVTDTLQELETIVQQHDTTYNKFYNYQLNQPVTANPGDEFSLLITLPDGRTVTGTTTIQPVVPIDTVKFTGEPDELTLTAYFQDPAERANYYRFLVHRTYPYGNVEDDDLGSDRLNNGKYNTFYTSDKFKQGDTLVVTLYSLEPAYYDFIRTLEDAENANGNPFAQPSTIKSTVQGGIGVFTGLSYHRKYFIIP